MKIFFPILLLLLSFINSNAQRITDNNTRVGYDELRANKWIHIPLDTLRSNAVNADHNQQIAKKNGYVYHYSAARGGWKKLIDSVGISLDSAAYNATNGSWSFSRNDGSTLIVFTGLVDSLQKRVKYTDTSVMLSPYMQKGDTTSLSNRINAKISLTEKAVANGVATLDAAGHIPSNQLPPVAITHTYVVSTQAAMLALAADTGDVAVRTDISKSFILRQPPASILSNWQELLTPGAPVQSVNGQTGVVNLTTTNISEGTNQYFTTARARSSVSAGTGLSYNLGTGVFTNTATIDQTLANGATTNKNLNFNDTNYIKIGAQSDYGAVRFTSTGDNNGSSVMQFVVGDNSDVREGWEWVKDTLGNPDGMSPIDTIMRLRQDFGVRRSMGIGTLNPVFRLDVVNAGTLNTYSVTRNNFVTTASGVVGNTLGVAGTLTNHAYVFYTNAIEKARIDTAGRFGIGLLAPVAPLHVYRDYGAGGSGHIAIFGGKDNWLASDYEDIQLGFVDLRCVYPGAGLWDFVIKTGSSNPLLRTEALRVAGNGFVGANVSTPTSRIDINGNGYNQLRLRTTYTPTSSSDTNGNVGDIAWDANYFYWKSATGWNRVARDNTW